MLYFLYPGCVLPESPLIPLKNIPRIHLPLHIVQDRIITVRDDGVGLGLELRQVIDYQAAEEGGAVFEGGLVDDDPGALGLDALHDALDGGLAEVVGVRFHREPVNAHDHFVLLGRVVGAGSGVVPGPRQHLVGNVVLAGPVAVHDGLDEVLRDVVEVRQELLRVLREAIAAVPEARVVVVAANAGIQAHSLDNRLGVKALHLRIGVQFVEVRHPQRQIRVRKQLHRLRLRRPHEQHRHLLLDRPALDQRREGLGGPLLIVVAHNNPGGIQVVIQRLALPQELRGEEDLRDDDAEGAVGLALAVGELLADAAGVAHGHGALDHHHGVGIDLEHEVDDLLHVGGVEEILLRVVVRRGRNDHEISVLVRGAAVEGGHEVQGLLREVLLDVFVLDGADAPVDLVHFLRNHVYRHNLAPLGEQGGDAQSDVPGTGNCDFHKLVIMQ